MVSEEKAAQFHILRSLMERPDVTELVNACDAGREGELIFRLVYETAGCSKPFSRLWISSMEDAAIRDACDGQQAVCVSLVREEKTEKPPKLYDLTTLQREANRAFGYTAK